MTLDSWLLSTGTPDKDFACRIGVSRVTLFRLKTGRRLPDRLVAERIFRETAGIVTPNDFYGLGTSPLCSKAACEAGTDWPADVPRPGAGSTAPTEAAE